ncbi:MAG: hypothetical protein WC994_00195 [Brumimicrobium sp.]
MIKNLLFIAVVVGAFALTSCKKSHTCTYPDGSSVTYSKDDQFVAGSWSAYVKAAESSCKAAGGTWK